MEISEYFWRKQLHETKKKTVNITISYHMLYSIQVSQKNEQIKDMKLLKRLKSMPSSLFNRKIKLFNMFIPCRHSAVPTMVHWKGSALAGRLTEALEIYSGNH